MPPNIQAYRIRVRKQMVHYTFQHIYTTTESSPDVIQYYNNIISQMRKCENTRKCTGMNSIKVLTSLKRENSRDSQGGLEGCGSERSAEDPRYCCVTLIREGENLHAPGSRTWTWESRGVKWYSPGEWWSKIKWWSRVSTIMHISSRKYSGGR